MEKSGSVTLTMTPEDWSYFEKGLVSPRIHRDWGLTFSELRAMIQAQSDNTKPQEVNT
jgi:hypothetical protein